MKSLEKCVAVLLSLIMLLSIVPASEIAAENGEEKTFKVVRINPDEYDWRGKDAAYIDFSEMDPDSVPVSGTVEGTRLSLVTSESTGNTRASNVIDNHYLLLGKGARRNDNPADMKDKPIVTGAIYIKLDASLAEKAKTPHIVRIDYYGGNIADDDAVNGASYIDLCHNSLTSSNTKTRLTYGTSWSNNAVSTLYFELPEANFAENIGDCKADFRLETWTGARLRIRSISVMPYEPLDIPPMTEILPEGEERSVASADFSTIGNSETDPPEVPAFDRYSDEVLKGSVAGNGLTVITSIENNSRRAANRITEDGYMLLGKDARYNTLTGSGTNQGRIYVRLDKAVAEKQGKAYAVKVEFLGDGAKSTAADERLGITAANQTINSGTGIYITHAVEGNNQKASVTQTFSSNYNNGQDNSLYFLLDDANFAEKCHDDMNNNLADFRLENNASGNQQLKIKSISVVAYDASKVTDIADAPALFEGNEAASIDFKELVSTKSPETPEVPEDPKLDRYADEILNGSIAGDGLSVITNIDNGTQRAANRITEDGYMLLGLAARYNTLMGSGVNQGRIYVKLDKAISEKQNKAYAIKVDYLDVDEAKTAADDKLGIPAANNTLDAQSWISVVYTNAAGKKDAETAHVLYGNDYNSGQIKSMYFLLPDANFSENVDDNGQNKGADFKLNTQTDRTQLKIRGISVVSYDASKVTDVADAPALFEGEFSGTDHVYINVTKGERYGLEYPAGSSVYKIIDNNGEHYGVQSVDDLSFKITDPRVKAAKEVTLTIKYWDVGTRSFSIQYNAQRPENWEEINADSFYTYYSSPSFEMYDSKELITLDIPIDNAAFEGRQNSATDFRVHTQYIADFYIEEIALTIGVEDVTERDRVPFPETTKLNDFTSKTIVGYQAWFQASDSQTSGWNHWNSGAAPAGGKQTFDIYPDVSDYPDSILFQTGYADLLNGQPAILYDGTTEEAIDTQVKWMKNYGIDGFAVSRFYSGTSAVEIKVRNKLDYMKEAAEKYGRIFYMGYDMSGIGGHGSAGIKRLESDFVLNVEQKYVTSPNYAQIDGKPVISLWGFQGSEFNRYPNTEDALSLIKWFHDRGYYVIGGCPDNNWALDTSDYAEVYRQIDMITPWTVGRYNHTNAEAYLTAKYEQDRAYIDAFNAENPDHPKSYMSTIYPGFSWANWASGAPNAVQRNAGEFMWVQAKLAKQYGFTSSFIAMFDEYDEGTAIAKMAEDSLSIPRDQYFVTAAADGKWLSSDFYLRLTGAITQMLKGEIEMTDEVPIPHATGPVFWRNGFERRYINYKNSGNHLVTALANLDVCVPNGQVLTNVGIDDVMCFDIVEDYYGEGYTTTGEYSFNMNGITKPENGKSRFDFKIADTAIKVQEKMVLQYNLRAENELGGHVFVDLMFDNGKRLSELGGGDAMKAERGTIEAWSPVIFEIPSSMAGHSITSVIIAYDYGAEGEFNAYIDDVVIQYSEATRDALMNLITDVESLLSGIRAEGFTAGTVANLRQAITKAKAVAAKTGATASEIRAAYENLSSAMNALVAVAIPVKPQESEKDQPPVAPEDKPETSTAPPDSTPGTTDPGEAGNTIPGDEENTDPGDGENTVPRDEEKIDDITKPPTEGVKEPGIDVNVPPAKSGIPWLLIGIAAGVTVLGLLAMIIFAAAKKRSHADKP